MIIRTHPINQVPDVEKIKDELVKQFGRDFCDVFIKTIRNIYDDVTVLNITAERVVNLAALPTATTDNRGKAYLVEGTGGAMDAFYLSVDTGGGGFGFKNIALI